MKIFTYLGKQIDRPDDLAPRGIRSTCDSNKLSFNETFEVLFNFKK